MDNVKEKLDGTEVTDGVTEAVETPVFNPEKMNLDEDSKGNDGPQVKVVVTAQKSVGAGIVDTVSHTTASVGAMINDTVNTVGNKVTQVKEASSKVQTAGTAAIDAAYLAIKGEERQHEPKQKLNPEDGRTDSNFPVLIPEAQPLPIKYSEPTTVESEYVESLVAVRLRKRAAAFCWIMAASKLPRVHQVERHLYEMVKAISKTKVSNKVDVMPIACVDAGTSISDRLEQALLDLLTNNDPGILKRVFEVVKPCISVEDLQVFTRPDWQRVKPVCIFEPENYLSVPENVFRQQLTSVTGRTESSTVPESSEWTRMQILGHGRIAPEDCFATMDKLGMLSVVDLITMLSLATTTVRRIAGDHTTDAFKKFDSEVSKLYINGAPNGFYGVITAAKEVTSGPQCAIDLCTAITSQQGIVLGLILFLSRYKQIVRARYFFVKSCGLK